MTKEVRPMLAATAASKDIPFLTYPMRLQPKLDGIRCMIVNGRPMSRSGKEIPNEDIRQWVYTHHFRLEGLDGELIVGPPTAPDVYQRTQSAVMTHNGACNFRFYCFDFWNLDSAYAVRRARLEEYLTEGMPLNVLNRIGLTPEAVVSEYSEVEPAFQILVEQGYEGGILRHPGNLYKFGRSTLRQQSLIKLKDFQDCEGVVTGYGELLRNENEAQTSPLGFTVRSSHQANKSGGDCLGYLKVKAKAWPEFNIGTGFDQHTRDTLWAARDTLIGRLVKFKYMPSGTMDRPRHPVFLGFRDPRDT